tara:strand:- start:15 stop:176 length:162 start_codon:yes stop_codon:yes gene_type:complete
MPVRRKKAKRFTPAIVLIKKRVRRKGVHAKSKTSKNKGADNYKKPYNRQGIKR